MRQIRGYTLVAGPRDGQRIALDEAYMRLVVVKPQGIPFAWTASDFEPPNTFETIEYVPVRGVPNVLAPYGTPPELVIDMLVGGYASLKPKAKA